jgi:hypothetical protein
MSFADEYSALRKKRKKSNEETARDSIKNSMNYSSLDIAPVAIPVKDIGNYVSAPDPRTFTGGVPLARSSTTGKTEDEKNDVVFKNGEGNVLQNVLGTVGDALVGVGKGALGMIEGVADLILYGGNAVYEGITGKETNFEQDISKSMTDQWLGGAEEFVDKYSYLGDKADAVSQGIGQIGLIMATGGAAGALGAGTAGATAVTTAATGLSSMGGGMGEAFQSGATEGEAWAYGAMSGVIDAGTELIFGGLGKAVNAVGLSKGISSLDDAFAKKLSSKISSQFWSNAVEFGVKAGAEGVEEVLAGIGSAVSKKLTYMDEEELGQLIKDEKLLDQFVVGAVTSGIAQSGIVPAMKSGSLIEANKQGTDFITGYTQNEQKVIDTEYNNRVAEAEKDGKKLSKKEKSELYEQVQKDLEKGYISTGTIESVLGGEDYSNYQREIERQNAQDKELAELRNMKSGEMTDIQIERMAELKAMKPNTEMMETLKFAYEDKIRNSLTTDNTRLKRSSYLAESYNEQARRGQKFEADLTQYDEKQAAVVQKAIDSGILNNTNRTHEFVDMVAKISADKGVSFDFTNNQKLKESGFAVDGKTVNGYVTKDGITINVNSAKGWQSVVGHEISHVLEGTELYTEMQSALFEYAKSKKDFDGRRKNLEELYKDVKDADIDGELTADLVGDYLFTDEGFIANLSTKHRNVFQKIYDEVKYLLKIATAGSKEARDLERVKRAFDKAYRTDSKASGDTKYSVSEEGNLGYHAGDLGKAESLGSQGYGRDTGHFGRGTYFVGNKELVKDYNKRDGKQAPQHAVDFTDYNLYKVRNDKDGYALHDQLRVIDGGINDRWIAAASRDDFRLASITEWADIAKGKYGEDGAYSTEGQIYGLTELAKREDIEIPSREEFAEREGYDLSDEYLDDDYAEHLKDIVQDEIKTANEQYAKFRDAYYDLQLRFGFGDKVLNAMKQVLDYQTANDRRNMDAYKKDSLATVFMKSLGYEGVDTRGTALDNTMYGSVIYDIKDNTVKYSLDKYSQKQYNNFGWARDTDAITKNELDDMYSKLHTKRSLKDFPQTYYGEAIIEVNDDPYNLSANNVIVFAKGTKNNPEITRIIRVDAFDEDTIDIFREVIYENTSSRAIEALARRTGEEFLRYYDRSHYADYRAYTERTRARRSGSEIERDTPANRNGNQRNGASSKAQENEIAPIKASSEDGVFFDGEKRQFSLSDSDGKQLSKEQQDYFKDSKMRDEDGNLKVMYHGSQDAGFHVFDPAHSDDETSLFFVDRNDVAASYSGTTETYEAQSIRTAEDMNKFIESIGAEGYEVVEKDGKFTLLYEGERVADSNTAQGIYEEFCWYEGVGEGDANYKVYLNLTNPLEVDAEGRNWNNISREFSREVYDRYQNLTAEEKAALTNLAEWGEYSIFKDEMLDARAAAEQGVSSGFGDVAFTKTLARAYAKLGGANANLYDAFSIASDNFSEESLKEYAVKQMNTRDYAKKAKAEGYDGVIFKNIVDVGGYSNGSEGASTVAIAFDSNQIKSVANDKPTRNADIRYSISGVNALTANTSMLLKAEHMLNAGADSETVRQKTGWYKGYDGKMRFEIDDSKSELIENPNLQKHEDDGTYFTGKLSDILKHDDLYEAYPQLRNVNIVIQPTDVGISGIYQANSNYITLSMELFRRHTKEYSDLLQNRSGEIKRIEQTPEYKEYIKWYEDETLSEQLGAEQWLAEEEKARNKFFSSELGKRYHQLKWGKDPINKFEFGWSKQAREVLMHEVQHAVQTIEGFARGSSPSYWKRRLDMGLTIKTAEQTAQKKAIEDKFIEILEKNPSFFVDMQGLMGILPKVPRGEVNWDTLEKIEEDPIEWQVFDEKRDALEEKYGSLEVFEFMNLHHDLEKLRKVTMSAGDAYYNTAGEIEARDTEHRLNMNAEQRRSKRPDIDNKSVVFADAVYSLSAEQQKTDANYLEAVNKGDTDTAHRLVQEAAEKAMPNSKVRDASGNLLLVYHGSPSKFTVFDHGRMNVHGNAHGRGFYFTENKNLAEGYEKEGGQLLEGYLNIENPMSEEKVTIKKSDLVKLVKATCEGQAKQMVADGEHENVREALFDTWVSNYVYTYGMNMNDAYKEVADIIYNDAESDVDIVAELTNGGAGMANTLKLVHSILGYDGVIYTNFDGNHEFVSFVSNQFKSAETATYDDSGNVIPLSERFNKNDPDIRRSLSQEGEAPTKHGSYYTPLKDLALDNQEIAPVQETVDNSVAEAAPVVDETVAPVAEMPSEPNLQDLYAEKEDLENRIREAMAANDQENAVPLIERYKELFREIEQMEADESERLHSLSDADMPPETEAPYYGESEAVSVDDPFENRDIDSVGNRKVKAYMFENPEVKPFFQEEAQRLLGELERTEKPQTIYLGDYKYNLPYDAAKDLPDLYRTSRQTTEDIAYLRDTLNMSYADIEKGIKAIIEDNGAENIAAAKKIEFILNDRLMNGYNAEGVQVPPDQGYLNLLNEKQITEYNDEARKQFFEVADEYAPMDDIAPVTDDIAPVAENIAPVAEKYEAIRPKRTKEPSLKRVDSEGARRGGEKERSWVETSTESEAVDGVVTPDDIPDDARYYKVKSNKKTLETANARLAKDGYAKAREYFEGRMSERKLTVEDIALGERLIQEAAKAGDAKAVRDLIIDVSILGTELGQRVQALSIIQRLTPEGQLKVLTRIVERGKAKGDKAFEGVEVTEDMTKRILDTKKKDGTFDQAELDRAVEDVKQQIADQMNVTKLEKANAWRYLAMLGNPKTHGRNFVSNIAMLGTRVAKNAVARTIEDIAPIKNRTKTWKHATDAVKEFAKQTTEAEIATIKGDNKYSAEGGIKEKRKIFESKILQPVNKLMDLNTRALEWEDTLFSKLAYRRTLQEYLTANGIETEADIKNNPELVVNAKDYALEEARRATFQQESYIANKISEIEKKNPFFGIAVGSVMPFKRTPINIAKTGAAYSPLGFARNIYDAVKVSKGEMDASEAIDHLAQTLTGTSLALIGFALANAGVLNGAGDDDKEGKYDYQLGKQSYSFNFGGDSYTLNWLSPVAMPLFVGANLYEGLVEKEEWDMNMVVDTLGQTLDPMSEMSFLSSLDDVLSSYDSGMARIWGAGESMIQNYATQFVPTLSSQLAATIDDTKRSTRASGDSGFAFGEETLNKIKYKIPFVRNTLEPTTDIWGDEIKQNENVPARFFESFLSPANKREDITSAVDEELKELYGETGKNELLPSIPYDYINYKDVKYDMSAKDYTAYKQTYGHTAFEMLDALFATNTYKNADAETRADLVADVYDYARDLAKKEYLAKQGVDFYNATEDKEEVYKENPIKGAIENDVTPDEYSFSVEYPEKYAFFKNNGISYSTYKAADENGKRAYTWAYENPAKYTMSKAIADDFMTYYNYKSELDDIRADKDEDGKSISGSAKEKKIEYINNLDLDYGSKIILFRSMYDSAEDRNAYNADIVEYLNSRDDISYDEMATILKELGFKVYADGTVRW